MVKCFDATVVVVIAVAAAADDDIFVAVRCLVVGLVVGFLNLNVFL